MQKENVHPRMGDRIAAPPAAGSEIGPSQTNAIESLAPLSHCNQKKQYIHTMHVYFVYTTAGDYPVTLKVRAQTVVLKDFPQRLQSMQKKS